MEILRGKGVGCRTSWQKGPRSLLAITRTGGRFEILVAGKVIGKAAYKTYDGARPSAADFYHTVINKE
jgi:hypothetical protein